MLNKLLFLFASVNVLLFSVEAAENPPKYRLIDLGTLGTDESEAIAINDNDQVLGILQDKGKKEVFLWDEKKGIQIIECPGRNNLRLNNKGQIAGNDSSDFSKGFIWDPNLGFFYISVLDGQTYVTSFNDNWQVIGHTNVNNEQHAFFWDHGKVIDLTLEFNKKFGSGWYEIQAVSINSLGLVALTATNAFKNNHGMWTNPPVFKSFFWKDGNFTMILPEKNPSTNVKVSTIDDNGNMIAEIENQLYFINHSENYKAYLFKERCSAIRNNLPMKVDCFPGKLKKDANGELYFAPGLWITKLFIEEEPFYDVRDRRSARINDQNSKGYVVGVINTMYPGRHAFLAIPMKE